MRQDRMTSSEYQKMALKGDLLGQHKYRVASPKERAWSGVFKGYSQNILFASKREMLEFSNNLLFRWRDGAIRDLTLQPKFDLGLREFYVGDFLFFDVTVRRWVCVDVKGVETALFKSKWKRVKALYPDIDFRIVK